MNNFYLQMGIAACVAFTLCVVLIPGIVRISIRLKLVDIPNERKVHSMPIPRMGGIAISISAVSGILLSRTGVSAFTTWPVLFSSLAILFLVGVWDDLKDISARLRLFIQVGCAIGLAATGLRLTSLYGIFGIHTLNSIGQYGVTVLIIAGTTNAFNLIDGVDGLAGGLAFIGLAVLASLSFLLQLYPLTIMLLAFAGAVLGFLRYNKSPATIFMGDGGSLILGYLMSATGILLIEKAHDHPQLIAPHKAALLVTSVLVIPVFDTLRVFASRIRKGGSPFKADKTHIHHLLLVAGMDHRRTSRFLYVFELMLIVLALTLSGITGVSIIMTAMVAIFHLLTRILWVNQEMEHWLSIIKKMECE